IANMKVYLLDEAQQPVPIGVPGEMFIGGIGVGRGYLNRPDLTAERFVASPFKSDERLYKTGDLGRFLPTGEIEYLGRTDFQVKMRGVRIELGDIERGILQQRGVKEAVVIAREANPGEKRLVAYFTALDGEDVRADALRRNLSDLLPPYMVPSAYVRLDAFPLTPNGKLNRSALPAPDLDAYVTAAYEPPRGAVEEDLATVWRELLGIERVGRDDNFFELGGHSVLVIRMKERLRASALTANLRALFESQTLKDLAVALRAWSREDEADVPPNRIPVGCSAIRPDMLTLLTLDQEEVDRIVASVPGGAENVQDIYPLAPLQEGILFHHLLDQRGGDTYVLSTVLSVRSQEQAAKLVEALQSVVDGHDILRTAVVWEQIRHPVQVVYRQAPVPVRRISLENNSEKEQVVSRWLGPEHQRISLTRAPLMYIEVAENAEDGRCYVLLRMHHIIGDQSLRVIICESLALLAGRSEEPGRPGTYRRHVWRSLEWVKSHDSEAFFREKLAGFDEPTAPFGLLDVHADPSRIAEITRPLEQGLEARVRAQSHRAHVSAATLFHTACAVMVARTSGRDEVVFGTVLLGQTEGAAEETDRLGLFINTLPIRLFIREVTVRELVERTQGELIELLQHEMAPLTAAQRGSGIASPTPLFTTLLNFRHNFGNMAEDWDSAAGI